MRIHADPDPDPQPCTIVFRFVLSRPAFHRDVADSAVIKRTKSCKIVSISLKVCTFLQGRSRLGGNIADKIVGGINAAWSEFPWQVRKITNLVKQIRNK